MVQLLLENGADCNIRDKQERRPLHWASYVGYTDIIKVLVDFGADVNCLDKDVINFLNSTLICDIIILIFIFIKL